MIYKLTNILSFDDGHPIEYFFPHYGQYEYKFSDIFPDEYVIIDQVSYKVIPVSFFYHNRGDDGYYRAIYIEINFHTHEYYIGKINSDTWSRFKRYRGSGVVFKNKYKKHKNEFGIYYIVTCKTQIETEEIEKKIVNKKVISDPFCLNCVEGGGGVSNKEISAERKERQSEYMKKHPERYEEMLKKANELFSNPDSPFLINRNAKIAKTMSGEFYRKQSRERMQKWKENNPEAYKEAREKNLIYLRSVETQKKRKNSLEAWKQTHPEEYAEWQRKMKESRESQASKEKRKESLRIWRENNPEKVKERGKKSAAKRSKPINMLSLLDGSVVMTFTNSRTASQWLFDNGYTKSRNAYTTINAVALKKSTPGHGTRKSAYGFGWEYIGN